MTLQRIKSLEGRDEYVLLPVAVYQELREQIERKIAKRKTAKANGDFVPFVLDEYVNNPVALARMKAEITQGQLAHRMRVSQAYVSKIESQSKVSAKVLAKVYGALQVAPAPRMKRAA